MKIVMSGGSGQVGTVLARAFHERGDEVIVLSRTPTQQPWKVIAWDAETLGDWTQSLEGAEAVINLAGRSVNCRYTPANRRSIIDSRVQSTRAVGEAIAQTAIPPHVWLQASTATIYSHRYDAPNDDLTGVLGGNELDLPDTWRFSLDVARRWEEALAGAHTPRTRKVALRSAMVMSPDSGGVFDTLLRLVRHGLGGRVGSGRQYVSWIHDTDFVRSVQWLIEHSDLDGPVNLASPNPLAYRDFMRALRAGWGIKFGLPATEWMVEIGTRILQTESELALKSRRVTPKRLLDSGFAFQFPEWPEAAADLCARWQVNRA
ncbi:MAG: TIGR01777 family oxidoreductase [Janthinobacterium lividum]